MANRQRSSLRLEKGSWRLEAKGTAGILLVLALLGLLCWLCLAQASKVSTAKHRIWAKEAEKKRLQRKNADLLAGVMELASIRDIEKMALGLGYVRSEERRHLDVPDYPTGVSGGGLAIAPRPDGSAVVALGEPRDKPAGVARWWEKVISQFTAWAGTQP